MAMTEERRNEIAWLFLVAKTKKIPSVRDMGKLPEELGISDKELREFLGVLLSHALSWHGFSKFYQPLLPVYHSITWKLLVHKKWKEGIKIGELVRRQIGTEAEQIGISMEEGMEFARLVVEAVVEKTFA